MMPLFNAIRYSKYYNINITKDKYATFVFQSLEGGLICVLNYMLLYMYLNVIIFFQKKTSEIEANKY